jgi:hypothetical protein
MRGSLVTFIGLALSVSAVPLMAPAHADTATEVIVPATMRTTPRTAYPQSAGASGFLEYRSTAEGSGLWWTSYDGSRAQRHRGIFATAEFSGRPFRAISAAERAV